ncbi:hypothetical protein EDL96_08495 [Kocuria soli]|uniref:Uncharacterized protein n=1 Tax=Kocuria soli TaxID=2485125 RepID=A0A3N3ZS99_9MICC|nr:hypothetical protein [Kocuria soli]ROZ62809.1 hypothetical protein EDL96_08495 [Kocuria soli]
MPRSDEVPQRVPYVLEYQGRTVVLGEPFHLAELDRMLTRSHVSTTTTVSGTGGTQLDGVLLNSVSVDLPIPRFWEQVQSAAFDDAPWPADDSPVTVPEPPAWLAAARCWEYDPVAPVLPAVESTRLEEPGGWLHSPGFAGFDTSRYAGSVGLFQLMDQETFWVLASTEDLVEVRLLALDLARYRRGFRELGVCFDEFERPGSLRLPLICREVLEDELIARSVDIEPRFWPRVD